MLARDARPIFAFERGEVLTGFALQNSVMVYGRGGKGRDAGI